MAKRFLTARDIDEHADNGILEIRLHDDLVVTDIGQERARERGVKLVRMPAGTKADPHPPCDAPADDQIRERVRSAVIAKLGGTPENLEAILNKVLNGRG